ncbi:MAG: amino acid permease [Litorivivens sp.]|jgi:amino acid permease
MTAVIFIQNLVAFSVYVVVAVLGYISFAAGREPILDNIIQMYPNSIITMAGEACLACQVLLSIPLLV